MFNLIFKLLLLSIIFTVSGTIAAALHFCTSRNPKLIAGKTMYYVWLAVMICAVLPLCFGEPALFLIGDRDQARAIIDTSDMGDSGEQLLLFFSDGGTAEASALDMASKTGDAGNGQKGIAVPFSRVNPAHIIFAVYLAGVLFSVFYYFDRYRKAAKRLYVFSRPCRDKTLYAHYLSVARSLALTDVPSLRVLDDGINISPCVCGLKTPYVYIDKNTSLSPDANATHFILTHELCHVRKKDAFYKLFALAVCSVHWYNPISHCLIPMIFDDCELACDADVVAEIGGDSVPEYMNAILDVAGRTDILCGVRKTDARAGELSFASSSALRFLTRRYDSMKNPGKKAPRAALVCVFAALIFMMNATLLSGCGIVSNINAANGLSPLAEFIVRYNYNLSSDETITQDQINSITYLKFSVNPWQTFIENSGVTSGDSVFDGKLRGKYVVDFAVNEKDYGALLIMGTNSMKDMIAAIDAADNGAGMGGQVSGLYKSRKVSAYYTTKNPDDDTLSEISKMQMFIIFPFCRDFSCCIFDPTATANDINAVLKTIYDSGYIDALVFDSLPAEAYIAAYFPNLEKAEFAYQ